MSRRADLDRLLDQGDLDGLVRIVDDCCDADDWDLLEVLATRCRGAVERGHQLWPAADHAEHRLALEAPGPFAARAVARDSTRFGPAPLAEVAASSHSWADLADDLPIGPLRAMVAHERVARGEDLTGLDLAGGADPLGLPFRLAAWEPDYRVPTIGPYAVEDLVPAPGPLVPTEMPAPGAAAGHEAADGLDALRALVRAWVEESNGSSRAIAVRGDGGEAVAALLAGSGAGGMRVRMLPTDDAISLMAWAGASGGAHGRRRGAARGRFEAWWCLAAVGGLLQEAGDTWPPAADEVGDLAGELRWWQWDAGSVPLGWHLNLAVEDPADGLAWALVATDVRDAGGPSDVPARSRI